MASKSESPLQPKTILRGHKSQVHAVAFIRNNERLVTGDADGYVIAWDLAIMRPRAVWQAHDSSILGLAGWQTDRIITHGRDNKLIVWNLSIDDECRLGTDLPLNPSAAKESPRPWILHLLDVNTMNFCSFTMCPTDEVSRLSNADSVLVAVPNTLATEAIDIFHLPSQQRRHTIKPETDNERDGMVMAISMFHNKASLNVVVGYENGLAAVIRQCSPEGDWATIYTSTPHKQPILSLDMSPCGNYFFTSSADAIITKHIIPERTQKLESLSLPFSTINTRHAGQQSLRLRDDGRIFATGGWDGTARVYSAKTLNELAVLRWHKVGCYAVAFARVSPIEAQLEHGSPKRIVESRMELDEGLSSTMSRSNNVRPEDTLLQSGGRSSEHKVSSMKMSRLPKLVDLSVRERREKAATETHWLAVGSKDGKISLWDIY